MSSSIFTCPGIKSTISSCSCPLDFDCLPDDKAQLAKKKHIHNNKNNSNETKKKKYARSVIIRPGGILPVNYK